MLDKATVVASIIHAISEELHAMESIAGSARDEATSSETKAEGKYDTRATEASYLARGQAWRIVELRRLLAWLETLDPTEKFSEPVAQVGTVVEVSGAREELIFLAPIGGAKADINGRTVRVISPSSPIGAAMVELEVGDEFEIDSPRGVLQFEIVSVR